MHWPSDCSAGLGSHRGIHMHKKNDADNRNEVMELMERRELDEVGPQ
jgi:hypothetical protein